MGVWFFDSELSTCFFYMLGDIYALTILLNYSVTQKDKPVGVLSYIRTYGTTQRQVYILARVRTCNSCARTQNCITREWPRKGDTQYKKCHTRLYNCIINCLIILHACHVMNNFIYQY